ncbi:MAG: hypothetical protein IMZ64_12920 [Bacteroidetes bacterium]|nr:hypothetical protein [Bacteroidota bacterium]
MNTEITKTEYKGKDDHDPAHIEIKGIGADDHAANIERVKDCYKDYARPPAQVDEPAQDPDPEPAQEMEPAQVDEPARDDAPAAQVVDKKGTYTHKSIDVESYPAGAPITIKQEAACLKALDAIFDAGDNKELLPVNRGLMDVSNIMLCMPKTEIGRRILSRFYDSGRTPTKPPVMELRPGPAIYALDLFKNILAVINSTDRYISIISGADRPIVMQNEHFIFYLAPRIESV